MTIRTRLTVLLGLALAAGCSRTPASSAAQAPVANGPGPVGPSGQNRSPSPVVAWLDCIECTPAQLQAVVALGDAAVPELTRTLATGPAQDRLDPQQKHIEASYATMKEYNANTRTVVSRLRSRSTCSSSSENTCCWNRMRSATATGAIGTTAAKTALTSALGQPDTPIELTREIERALKSSR